MLKFSALNYTFVFLCNFAFLRYNVETFLSCNFQIEGLYLSLIVTGPLGRANKIYSPVLFKARL